MKRKGSRDRIDSNRAIRRLKRDPEYTRDDEWRDAVRDMTEMDRAATEYDVRRADGMSGGPEDAKYAP